MDCRICGQPALLFSTNAILGGKYKISYYRCSTCGFIQTEDPYWLQEAYSEPINSSDIGLVSRNLIQGDICNALIRVFFDRNARFLDYGGGYGLFVRLMRDRGYDFHLYDPLCENLFAKTFEVDLPADGSFGLLTAFEVFEHLVHPLEEIEQMLRASPSIFFSTMLLPIPAPQPAQWWYYGLEHGQHVSIYSRESLAHIARRLGAQFYSDGQAYHLLTSMKLSGALFGLVTRPRIARVINQITPQRSLLADDYLKVVGRPLN